MSRLYKSLRILFCSSTALLYIIRSNSRNERFEQKYFPPRGKSLRGNQDKTGHNRTVLCHYTDKRFQSDIQICRLRQFNNRWVKDPDRSTCIAVSLFRAAVSRAHSFVCAQLLNCFPARVKTKLRRAVRPAPDEPAVQSQLKAKDVFTLATQWCGGDAVRPIVSGFLPRQGCQSQSIACRWRAMRLSVELLLNSQANYIRTSTTTCP